ncbi:GMC family oxidoreductase [Pseudomonas sp. SDO528_S397]
MPRTFENTHYCDYVIVGAGAAGSVIAARLGEDPKLTIRVLEAGPADHTPYIHIPAGFVKTLSRADITWPFKTEPSAGSGHRRISTTQGRVAGGSSSINGMIYVRGQPQDYDHWASLGNTGWGYQDVLPYFAKSERRIGDGGDGIRGRQGPIAVSDMDWFHPISEGFMQAAVEQGHRRNPDYNNGDQAGTGYFQRTIDRGYRVSAYRAFLKPAMKRGNITLTTHACVDQILMNGKRAIGVRYRSQKDGPEFYVMASKEVILCAGAVNTPRLLQISGIGPQALLAQLGVPLVHDAPGVGANLIDHYSARMVMRARPENVTLNELARLPRLAGQLLKWAFKQPSILAQVPSQVYLFCKSQEDVATPDLQCVFTPGSYKEGKHYMLDAYPGVTGGWWQHRPLSRGYVQAQSSDVFQDPLIQPNYLEHPLDQDVMVAGMKIIRRLLHATALSKYLTEETIPGLATRTDEQMLDFCQRHGSTGYHLVGTAKMGPASDRMAVVDAQLRVHGLDNLRVIDASVMPMITSGNTYAATLMIAEKGADLIKAWRYA